MYEGREVAFVTKGVNPCGYSFAFRCCIKTINAFLQLAAERLFFMKKSFNLTRRICLMGIFAAITVVLALYLTFRVGTQMKLSLKFISVFISGVIFGPLPAGIIAVLADMANAFIMPVGPWLWQITLTEFVAGLGFGAFFYKAKNNGMFYIRALFCALFQALLSLTLVTWILAELNIMPSFKAGVVIRLPQAVLMFVVYFTVMCLMKKFVFILKAKEGTYVEKL